MQRTCFCPKEQSWYKARRGDTERTSPGISPAAKEGCQAQPRSALPAPDSSQCHSSLQQHSGAFPAPLQAQDPTHSLEQGPPPGKGLIRQSPAAQLFCSQRDPRPRSPAPRGRDGEGKRCQVRDARDAACTARLSWDLHPCSPEGSSGPNLVLSSPMQGSCSWRWDSTSAPPQEPEGNCQQLPDITNTSHIG